MKRIFVPLDNALEASVIPDIDVIGIASLSDMVDILTGDMPLPDGTIRPEPIADEIRVYSPDFSDIIGQEHAKRALLIAAA